MFVAPLLTWTVLGAWMRAQKRLGAKQESRPCSAFLALQHMLLVSGVATSMESVQQSCGIIAGAPLLVFMAMKLHPGTQRMIPVIQPIVELTLALAVPLASYSHGGPIRAQRRELSRWGTSAADVLVYTCALPLLLLPSTPLGGAPLVGGTPKLHRAKLPGSGRLTVLASITMYLLLFVHYKGGYTLPTWCLTLVVVCTTLFGSMDMFRGIQAVHSSGAMDPKVCMTWCMVSVLGGLCLSAPQDQWWMFWVKVGMATCVGLWGCLLDGACPVLPGWVLERLPAGLRLFYQQHYSQHYGRYRYASVPNGGMLSRVRLVLP